MSLTLRCIVSNYNVHKKFISFVDYHEYIYGHGKYKETYCHGLDIDPGKKLKIKLSGEI